MASKAFNVKLAIIIMVSAGFIALASCGTEDDDEEEDTGTPTSVSSAFTQNCTTCHDADGIGGTTASGSDIIAYVKANSYDTFVNLVRNNPPSNMTATSASLYSDAAAKNDYDYFKAQ